MLDKNRHWYFITDKYFGESVVLEPRYIQAQGDDEPILKRICVAPTAAHCFAAIGTFSGARMNVYQTKRKVNGIKPWSVPDQRLTKEHWRRQPTEFVLVAELDVPEKASWPYGNRGEGPACKSSYHKQNCDKRQIRRWLKRLGDPRLYKIEDANQSWRIKR